MSFNSINTNAGAVVALQSLNKTNAQLDGAQKRVSTGYRVADARDDGGAFAVAQKVRGDIAGVTSANEQLGAAKGLLDTTLSGLNRISDTMATVRAVLVKLSDENVNGALRDSYTEQYNLLRRQIANFVNDSTYNEVSLLGRSGIVPGATAGAGATINVVRNERGESLTIEALGLIATGPGAGNHAFDLRAATGTDTAATWREYLTGMTTATPPVASANRTLAQVEAAVNLQLNRFGNAEKSVINQIGFNKDKIDALESGLGALIDADLGKESARLQSLQIRQQLGASALAAANTAPQFLLSLFR
jgi:flagellin